EFCVPTTGSKVPSGPEWFHEIKYDGYRLRVERSGDRVRLNTRGGYDWSKRYPWIVESALKNRHKQFVIDGEAVILGVDGISDFNGVEYGKQDDEVLRSRCRRVFRPQVTAGLAEIAAGAIAMGLGGYLCGPHR